MAFLKYEIETAVRNQSLETAHILKKEQENTKKMI